MLVGILAALILIYLLACLCIFFVAFGRQRDLQWENSEALKNTMWEPYAEHIPKNVHWIRDRGAQDVQIQSFDGLTLRGKWLPCDNARATIVVVHGYRCSYVSDFGMVLPLYRSLGFNILMLRHRAHGESQGKYITFGNLEHRDLISWVQYHNRTLGNFPVFISGISMGASTVMFAAGKGLPENVRGVTADSGFTSAWDIIGKVIKDRTGLSMPFLLPGINLWCRLIGKFDMKGCRTEELLPNIKVPILMIHGEADDLVPCEMSLKSFAACAGEKTLITIPGAGHGTGYLVDPETVRGALLKFFDAHL